MASGGKKLKLSKGNKRDDCWKFTIDFPGRKRTQTKCLFCKTINSGGINRLKYHIAGIRGHDTEPCGAATIEAQRFCYVALEKYEQEKELKRKQLEEIAQIGSSSLPRSSANVSESVGCVGEGSSRPSYSPSASAARASSTSIPCTSSDAVAAAPSSATGFTFRPRVRKSSKLDNFFVPRTTPGAQPSLESMGWNREIHEAGGRAICKFWFFCNIPFIAARYFKFSTSFIFDCFTF